MQGFMEFNESAEHYNSGYSASKSGKSRQDNPYKEGSLAAKYWAKGYEHHKTGKQPEKFTEEKKITVKTKSGGEIPATIKVTGKDYHIVKADASGKQYKVDHQGNSLEEEIELDEAMKGHGFSSSDYMSGAIRHDLSNVKQKSKEVDRDRPTADIDPDWEKEQRQKKMKKEESDKDLPFTPDAKKTKPSTPGKYGSAYSTVRNLARQAMQKQAEKLKKEELELDEAAYHDADWVEKSARHERLYAYHKRMGNEAEAAKHKAEIDKLYKKEEGGKISIGEEALIEKLDKKEELRAALNRHSQHAIEANRRGDDEAVKVHQGYMNKIKDKMAKLVRNEELVGKQHKLDVDKDGKIEGEDLAKLRKMKEETELQEASDAHKVMVTVSDPNHPAVSQRKEQIMKHVIVRAGDKGDAQAKAEAFYKKRGYKVHGSEYHSKQPATSVKTEEVELEEASKGYAPGWMLKADPELAKKVKDKTQGYKDLKKYAGRDIPKKEELDMKTFSQFMEEIQEIEEAKKDDYWDFKDLKEPSHVRKIAGKAYGGAAQKDDEDEDHPVTQKATEKRGRGRPKGSTSGARTAGAAKKSYGGLTFHSLNLPNSNK